jgi:hypothetical protein
MNARLDLPEADRRPLITQKCQQLDISEPIAGPESRHRDRPLSFRWQASYETLSRNLKLPMCKSRRGERAMASVVYDTALSARENLRQARMISNAMHPAMNKGAS